MIVTPCLYTFFILDYNTKQYLDVIPKYNVQRKVSYFQGIFTEENGGKSNAQLNSDKRCDNANILEEFYYNLMQDIMEWPFVITSMYCFIKMCLGVSYYFSYVINAVS